MAIKTGGQLAAAALDVAKNYKTLYVLGCFGAPMKADYKARYLKAQVYNREATRKAKIQAAPADCFGFDCGGLIKALLWGWSGDTSKVYGGATYASNGVPDIGADAMIKRCTDLSTDFSRIQVGEAVWLEGHIGVYVGDGLAVECTPRWADGVQVTAVHNMGYKPGYNGRSWTKHGKLPYVDYTGSTASSSTEKKPEPAADFTLGMRTLRRNDRGEDVLALQILLSGRGYNGEMNTPDGIYGPRTKGAVKLYQEAKGLEVDGIAGPKTWGSLLGV